MHDKSHNLRKLCPILSKKWAFPTTEEIKAAQEANKARAGVKTLKALLNGAGNVSLRLRGGQIEIKPWRYRGRGHEDTILPENVSDKELGEALKSALDISKSA